MLYQFGKDVASVIGALFMAVVAMIYFVVVVVPFYLWALMLYKMEQECE